MSQYNSRICIKVRDVKDWEKLSDIDFKQFGFWANPFDGLNQLVFEINGDWACYEDELESLLYAIDDKIPDCFLIGDTTNINVDPYAFIVYKVGDKLSCDEVEGDFQWETSLDDPFDWFNQAGVKLSEEQKKIVELFGF